MICLSCTESEIRNVCTPIESLIIYGLSKPRLSSEKIVFHGIDKWIFLSCLTAAESIQQIHRRLCYHDRITAECFWYYVSTGFYCKISLWMAITVVDQLQIIKVCVKKSCTFAHILIFCEQLKSFCDKAALVKYFCKLISIWNVAKHKILFFEAFQYLFFFCKKDSSLLSKRFMIFNAILIWKQSCSIYRKYIGYFTHQNAVLHAEYISIKMKTFPSALKYGLP